MSGFTPQMDDYLDHHLAASYRGWGSASSSCRCRRWLSPRWTHAFRTDATSLFSLVRNIGSSIGISIVTVMLTHNAQINHAELSATLTPFNPMLQQMSPGAAAGDPTALSQIDGLVNVQALMISYIDDFKLMMLVTLCAIPLALLLRKPKAAALAGPGPVAHAD